MHYNHFSAEDFVKDEYFQKWVTSPDESINIFWQSWLKENPEKAEVVAEARRIILLLKFDTDYTANNRFLEVWQELDAYWEQNKAKKSRSIEFGPKIWYKVAAVFTGLLLISTLYLFLTKVNATTQYITKFGETKTILLPDSSSVILNANSVLTYSAQWNADKPREVFLEGEAFFEVKKKATPGNASFIVHTENLAVEVLGTKFNVNHRRQKTQVVLNSGKIKLNTEKASAIDNMIMKPGDLVEFSQANKALTIRQVNPNIYSSWKNNQLILKIRQLKRLFRFWKIPMVYKFMWKKWGY
jgi:ferric-dicitrate binding protein FerR (iron transport regulator)